MKTKLGTVFMVLGSVLVLSALGLFLLNQREEQQAMESVSQLMPQVAGAILERREQSKQELPAETEPQQTETPAVIVPTVPVTEPEKTAMPVVEIEGHGYVGFVGIPSQKVELPVMADWSYAQLKIAPCRFTGDMYSDNIVIMAHNYDRHFAVLHDLRAGDRVTLTDMDGDAVEYEVVALDILHPADIEEMTAGEYDLTLFTCTYGGKSRVTVRCDRVEE